MKLPLCYPLNLPFGITQKFGENQLAVYKDQLGLQGHNGIDMSAKNGTPVYAMHDGIVTFAGTDGSGGLGVVIRTTEKFDYDGGNAFIKSIYWHLKTGSIIVKPDELVKAGQKIGEADNTGLSTGDHLHIGIKPIYQGEQAWQWFNQEQTNGYNGAIDPNPYFNGTYPKDITTESTQSKRQVLFKQMMLAVRDYQVECGYLDFQSEENPSRISIGPKTLLSIAKDKKTWNSLKNF